MIRLTILSFMALCLDGCGSPASAPPVDPPIAAKPDVIITFVGADHACLVALVAEPNGSTIPCAELVPFLRDELRVPSGSIYDTHQATAQADPSDIAKATQNLKDAGYRFIGGHE